MKVVPVNTLSMHEIFTLCSFSTVVMFGFVPTEVTVAEGAGTAVVNLTVFAPDSSLVSAEYMGIIFFSVMAVDGTAFGT